MSRRRLPKPRWRRYAAIAAAVVVISGGAALAGAVTHGGSSGDGHPADAVDAAQGAGTPLASSGSGAKSPSPSGKASPSAKVSGTAKASGTPTTTPTTSASATKGAATKAATAPTATPATRPGPAHPATARIFTGLAFDTCTAPSASRMSAWHANSPYGAAAVYVGGRNRGCAQPELTASWVRTVSAAGWRLIPLYVGAQPPCQTSANPEWITASNAASLGTSDGADAVADAAALGMRAGSAVYLDMESYDASDTACVNSVLTYVQAWDKAVHARGYWAGFYGFTSSSAAVVANAQGTVPDLPDALWYAKYDGNASTTSGFPFSPGLWTGHRRGHQYLVNQKETYGGVSLTVDRDAWDAPVAVTG
ncbi:MULTISPECIES: glycoside hydrolase domain-containing protein [unclassified Streptomyces]|uniref:glycoside hydrolase domain-containing protein n=1 Tax=unclassified Streptomyces TaxID=2593676 RepID=UPI003864089E